MKRLIVYLHGEAVGALTQDASGLLGFRYDPEWLRKPEAMPLSRSLPLGQDGMNARPFFAAPGITWRA